ncbi:DUF4349 domain-containing protein [Pinibacter soli]|uniref:DUF4349 domain-containing protein n=1 Tax=Pinibacter soli TaxID=3044211 RepID=A0ABT6R8J4_9BACT|nr:DUF4349 domain-containing protein [Pinibacter soli]MDI3318878.1 DUF4349 domain-containing protein [Pinibacter soli]
MNLYLKQISIVGAIAISIISCESRYSSESKSLDANAADSTATGIPASLANQSFPDQRKFIRTAVLKFKVDNVVTTSYKIEDIVCKNKGFVTYTNLTNNIANTETVQVTADSLLQTVHYNMSNDIEIRVPNQELDTTLKSIATLIGFIDYRIIKAEDVTLNELGNTLTQKRTTQHFSRITKAIDNKGKKLNDMLDAEDKLIGKEQEADDALVANLDLNDKVKYSTVKISLYQNEAVKSEMLTAEKSIRPYRPSFISLLGESLLSGWEMLRELILAIIKVWPVILLCVGVYFLVRNYKKISLK